MNATTANHLPQPPPCPECGSPRGVTTSPPPWPLRHLLLIQLIALACGLGWWAYKMAETWPTLPAPTVTPPGITSAEFPPQRFTRADLEAYAAGQRADGALLDAFDLEVYDPAVAIEAALVPPAGAANSGVTSYGWPFAIYSWRTSANYTDVYTFANPSSAPRTPVDRWFGWARVRIATDSAGRTVRSSFYAERIVASAVVVFIVWLGARLLWIALARFGPGRARSRRLRLGAPLLAAAIAAGAITAACLMPRTTTPPGRWPSQAPMPATGATGLTFGDVVALRNTPGGEAQLAAALLAAEGAVADAPAQPVVIRDRGEVAPPTEPVLIYAWRHDRQIESAHASGGWPQGLNIVATRAGDLPGAGPDRWRYKPMLDHQSIGLVRHNLADPAERTRWTYSLAAGAKVAAGLLILWYTLAAAGPLWRAALRRRDRRRARAGRCIPCGYDLRGSPSPSPPSSPAA